jgi:hypothetical protein
MVTSPPARSTDHHHLTAEQSTKGEGNLGADQTARDTRKWPRPSQPNCRGATELTPALASLMRASGALQRRVRRPAMLTE